MEHKGENKASIKSSKAQLYQERQGALANGANIYPHKTTPKAYIATKTQREQNLQLAKEANINWSNIYPKNTEHQVA
ncbi:hypothetical protein U1Q18_033043 [Sarracenia purpurea var. burkii]